MEDRGTLLSAAAAVAVLVSGVIEQSTQTDAGWRALIMLVVLGTALAVGAVRRLPWLSLLLAWLIPVCQVVTGTPLVITQAAMAFVAFGLARWGGRVILWLSALSILAGAVAAMILLGFGMVRATIPYASWDLIAATIDQLGAGWQFGSALLLGAFFGMPWLAGFAVRISDRARTDLARAARERAQAEQTARIRDAQTRLARDVHDVVGHSLAVILAQAESGQYLADDDPAALKSALATIATSARASLQDVREVLTTTRDSTDDLDQLIGNLRGSGHEVLSEVVGVPAPLDEARRTTAYRVLQEMLTNAIRHGLRGGALRVRRTWAGGFLSVEVRNAVSPGAAAPASGSGLDGMRERLGAVGGTLSASRDGDVFVATARIPLS
ncbi:sensor histidine kinase [Actinoplanes sp. CA-015351]|uniref:sensor histidine kinase n=1 Tax=Actinoplanes sp. CA-015351 TaxID=3239897 RepID=UPI003D9950F9